MSKTIEQAGMVSLCFASLLAASAQAASVSYLLDQSNELTDGVPYAKVTIDDDAANTLTFTVKPLGVFTPDSNFGVQEFGFNVNGSMVTGVTWNLPTDWESSGPKNLSEFGTFDFVVSGKGNARQDPLIFSLHDAGLTLDSFADASTKGYYFAAHIAGFATLEGQTSAFVAGSTTVPVPAPAWLLGTGLAALSLVRRRND